MMAVDSMFKEKKMRMPKKNNWWAPGPLVCGSHPVPVRVSPVTWRSLLKEAAHSVLNNSETEQICLFIPWTFGPHQKWDAEPHRCPSGCIPLINVFGYCSYAWHKVPNIGVTPTCSPTSQHANLHEHSTILHPQFGSHILPEQPQITQTIRGGWLFCFWQWHHPLINAEFAPGSLISHTPCQSINKLSSLPPKELLIRGFFPTSLLSS